MTTKRRHARRLPAFARKAEKALKIAVLKTIEDHRRAGQPIVVWEKGRVTKIPASRIPAHRTRERGDK